jgi:hypothetical protein
MRLGGAALVVGLALTACGGGKKKSKTADDDFGAGDPGGAQISGARPPADDLPFDEEFANRILERGARKAQSCATTAGKPPRGEGEVEVVFDGPKGQVVDVIIGPAFQEASEQGQACLKNAFMGEIIPPFSGTKTVPFTISLPEK